MKGKAKARVDSADRGFTLVELMVTVAILVVLTAVAVVSYKMYIRRARVAEGRELLQDIRVKQEEYFSTYSQYVDTGTNDTEASLYPKERPKTASGAPDTTMWDWSKLNSGCTTPSDDIKGWCHLGFRRNGPTYFRAVTIGWNRQKTDKPSSPYAIVNGMDFTKRWYYAVAHADFDEDGILSTFIMTSQANEIDTDKETE